MINFDDQNDPRVKRLPGAGFKAEVPDFINVLAQAMKPTQTDKDVHTEHCCVRHGCKYGALNCTVAPSGIYAGHMTVKPQSHMCEVCDDELRYGGLELAYLMNEMYDKGYSAGSSDVEHTYRCGCEKQGAPGCSGT
jgi:hypothetical protein